MRGKTEKEELVLSVCFPINPDSVPTSGTAANDLCQERSP